MLHKICVIALLIFSISMSVQSKNRSFLEIVAGLMEILKTQPDDEKAKEIMGRLSELRDQYIPDQGRSTFAHSPLTLLFMDPATVNNRVDIRWIGKMQNMLNNNLVANLSSPLREKLIRYYNKTEEEEEEKADIGVKANSLHPPLQ